MKDSEMPKMQRLVNRLTYATNSGQIEWQDTDRPHAFQYVTTTASVIVATQDDDGAAPFTVELVDSSGAIVETLSTHESGHGGRMEPTQWEESVENLYHLARRSVHDVDRVVDEILGNLPFPEEPEPPF